MMAVSHGTPAAVHLLVVLDHREARVYHTEIEGSVPVRITPFDPHGYGAHLHTSVEHTDGKSRSERKSFYEAIAKTLWGAEQILLFGSGTGKSSAMEQLVAGLTEHHADVAGKIIGTVKVDAHHTTESQLLAKARDFYAQFNRT